jgi:hypothetical protein
MTDTDVIKANLKYIEKKALVLNKINNDISVSRARNGCIYPQDCLFQNCDSK